MLDIESLIGQMTLEEKAALCSGADQWHTKAVERLGIPALRLSDGPHGLRFIEDGKARPAVAGRRGAGARRTKGGGAYPAGPGGQHEAKPVVRAQF